VEVVEAYLHVLLTLAHDLGEYISFTLLFIHRKTLWYSSDGLQRFSTAVGLRTPILLSIARHFIVCFILAHLDILTSQY
jgi:hypothetical protein